uniref:Protein kinase domain-containing protein n=1 Tax=Trichobilharzia regenti TaxID=157069 RepID=A0AA85JTP9_TRIRE|nr:unnamed protein product [Trichobilharzia regenti]
MGFNFASGIDYVQQTMYRTVVLRCECGFSKAMWTLNSSSISNKHGKILISGDTLKIFDLRRGDAGIYTCYDAFYESEACVSISLVVNDPEPYYKAVHENSVPDSEENERDRPYWHPKMKNTPAFYEFVKEPLRLACFFYFMNKSIVPVAEWGLPRDHDELNVKDSLKKPRTIDCNSIEETQRNLSGICYVMEITIHSISGTDTFDCIVRTPNNRNVAISNSYTVLQKLTHLFAFDLSDTDFDDFEPPKFELIDELRLPSGTNSSSVDYEDSYSDMSMGESSVNLRQHLNLSALILSTYDEFSFYPLKRIACLSEEVTLVCEIPKSTSQLEIWYFGKLGEQSKLLKYSKVSDMFNNNDKRYVQFDNSITLKITNLSLLNSGMYVCKNAFLYKNISITVMDCSKLDFIYKFLPPILIWVILFVTVSTIPLSMIFCLRAKRRSKRTIVSLPIDFKDKHVKPKRVNVTHRINILYGDPSQSQSLLFPSSSSSSSSSTSPFDSSPLSTTTFTDPNTSASTTTTTTASNTTLDNWIMETLTLLSQKLLHQQMKYLSHEQNIICHFHILLMNWLRHYLSSNPNAFTPRSSFILEEDIIVGEGTYGIVYKGKLRNPNHGNNCTTAVSHIDIAIKTLKNGFQERQFINLIRELKNLTLLKQHPHIIHCYGMCIYQGQPFILLELAVHGNLRDFLRNLRPPGIDLSDHQIFIDQITSPRYVNMHKLEDLEKLLPGFSVKEQIGNLLTFALNIADALMYFESLSLIHRDVAARNVVITEGYVAKLCDFGYTSTLDECNYGYLQMDKDYLPLRWMAPECVDTNYFTSKCDVWSFGILLWELFTLGNTPYSEIATDEVIDWVNQGNRNPRPYLSTEAVYQLMLDCWSQEPDNRPGFSEIYTRITSMIPNSTENCSSDYVRGYVEILADVDEYLTPRQ